MSTHGSSVPPAPIGCTRVHVAALERILAGLTRLCTMSICECAALSDGTAVALAKLTKLNALTLSPCHEITDSGLLALAGRC